MGIGNNAQLWHYDSDSEQSADIEGSQFHSITSANYYAQQLLLSQIMPIVSTAQAHQ